MYKHLFSCLVIDLLMVQPLYSARSDKHYVSRYVYVTSLVGKIGKVHVMRGGKRGLKMQWKVPRDLSNIATAYCAYIDTLKYELKIRPTDLQNERYALAAKLRWKKRSSYEDIEACEQIKYDLQKEQEKSLR